MNEFIINIKKTFDNKYYIGPYQRSYKWSSLTRYGQVPQMLYDIYSAMCQDPGKEYYLQYITIKWDSMKEWYEVIDGQQRLTTLSLIIYLLYAEDHNFENIAKDKVEYSRHDNSNLFDRVVELANNESTEESDNAIPNQDTYYLVKAARCIKRFLTLCKNDNKLEAFEKYLKEKVMLITNEESSFVSAEEVFMNLNDNRVPLTSSYLIKGLLLTLAARHDDKREYNYKEIIDQRVIMGRQWDEISSWISKKEVAHYFFKQDDGGLDNFLNLVLKGIESKNEAGEKASVDEVLKKFLDSLEKVPKQNDVGELELFNKFNDVVKTPADAIKTLKLIKHYYRRLRGIYENNKLYNLMGYALFCESVDGYKRFDLSNVFNVSDVQLEQNLKHIILTAIPDLSNDDIRELCNYSSSNYRLQNLLLSFCVFPDGEDDKYRFDFVAYNREHWSFEHISPQNPKNTVRIDKVAQSNVIEKIKNSSIKENKKKELIEKIRNDESIESESVSLLYDPDIDLDNMGNMALLSGRANSSLKNNPYIAKRSILFDMRNKGQFIPRHTIDIFNKVYHNESDPQFNFDLTKWDQRDVEAHSQWMITRNITIRKELSK